MVLPSRSRLKISFITLTTVIIINFTSVSPLKTGFTKCFDKRAKAGNSRKDGESEVKLKHNKTIRVMTNKSNKSHKTEDE